MIKLNSQNIFQSKIISEKDIKNLEDKIGIFLENIENKNQGFYKIFDDLSFVKKIENFSAKIKKENFSDIVICGIGGSALGAKTIRDYFSLNKKNTLHIFDNIDPDTINKIFDLDIKKTLFLIISKSGTTIETLAQYFYFKELFTQKNLSLTKNFVFISEKNSFLHEESKIHESDFFEIPKNIGGRFSVLTSVGLLPAALLNIDIKKILAGAEDLSKKFLLKNISENICFQLAAIQFLCLQKKFSQNVLMPYASKLQTFCDWFEQLLAESTGKNKTGITPIGAIGVRDQHSLLQLFADGPLDKLLIFLEINNFKNLLKLGEIKNFNFLNNKSFCEILKAELEGTKNSLTEKNIPNISIKIPELSSYYLGQLFFLFEGAVAFLGEFLKINAFDQPGVERGKILAKKYLIN